MTKRSKKDSGGSVIFSITWKSDANFITVGPRLYKSWELSNGKITKVRIGKLTRAKDDKLLSCVFDPSLGSGVYLVGTSKGNL